MNNRASSRLFQFCERLKDKDKRDYAEIQNVANLLGNLDRIIE
jgi:hypothetical protein